MSLDAVLPLLGRDVERARRLLLPTLAANAHGLSRIFVVIPGPELRHAQDALVGDHPFEIVFVPELSVVPEERLFPLHRRGWFLQQLIKLAMVDWVDGDFYMTLDCDLLCTRPWNESDVVWDGRAVLERDTLRHGQNLSWYEWASDVLGQPIPTAGMSVTPVVYSTAVIRGLAQHLETRVPRWMLGIAGGIPGQWGRRLRGWRMHLRRSIPWTEMSLYATYIDAAGLADRYHHEKWEPYLYGNNVWTREQFDAWAPADSLHASFLFSVVRSHSVAVDEVVRKVRDVLPVER